MRNAAMAACAAAALHATAASAEHHEAVPELTGGAANLSQEATRAAAQLVKEGKTYRLGLVTGYDTPAYPGRSYEIEIIDLGTNGSNRVSGHDDRVNTYLGIGSQIDGLGHVGTDGVHFGGVRAEEIFDEKGLRGLSAAEIPAIATRGVLIDMTRHFGVDRLEPGASFDSGDIRAAAADQGVTIGKGDVVLFHTGWLDMIGDPETFIANQPGIDTDGARYLAELGVVAVGSDTPGLETATQPEGQFIPVHQLLIAEYGVYILETLDTRELAADEVTEFLFVLGAPRFEGSVQAVINPVAIR
ncbi:MAG TPA: cyclase family protein [Sphingomonadaceae bacterium]|nr:cyclase family protein [Sphingomonadaceae bacterium]